MKGTSTDTVKIAVPYTAVSKLYSHQAVVTGSKLASKDQRTHNPNLQVVPETPEAGRGPKVQTPF